MEMLQQGMVTASEVAYKVGFGSATYFNSCFHKFYGYPPGEVKRIVADVHEESTAKSVSPEFGNFIEGNNGQLRRKVKLRTILIAASVIVLSGIISYLAFNANFGSSNNISNNRIKNRDKSIAVLPFVNLSDDKDDQYFTDGVMEDILSNLSQIREFKVISRTSIEQFRECTLSISEISKKLGVNYILEGSVQRYGDKVRIRVQFIDAGNDQHLLSKTFDRNLTDIFIIQSDIANQVANELQSTLSAKEIKKIDKIPTKNIEAYNMCLMGRFFWNKRNKTDQLNSIKYFEKALTIDPDYALAYAGLADAYFILTWYRWIPRPEGFVKAKKLALKALELDNTLAEAHATLGTLLCWSEWKWEEARKELLLATELNPNYATGHQYLAELSDIIGDWAGARASINRAIELDPYSLAENDLNAWYYYNEGKYKESLDAYVKTMEIFPERLHYYFTIFQLYLKLGDELKAVEAFQKYLTRDSISIKYVSEVENVYNRSGIKGLIIMPIEIELKKSNPNPLFIAEGYALLDEKGKALNWLEIAMEQRIPSIPRINTHPYYKDLHSEPRFQALIKLMGLSEYHIE
jgi:TolB-like protein/tetratricopeptide (TPR) repeat protein